MMVSDEEVWDDEVVVEALPPKWWKPKDEFTQKLFDKCRLEITALLIASVEGLPSDALLLEYKEITGEQIPYKELGFMTFFEFLYHAQDSMKVGKDKIHGTHYYFFNREQCPVYVAIKDLRQQVVSQQVSSTVMHLANLGCRGLNSKVNFLSHKCLLEIDKKTDPTVPPVHFGFSEAPRRPLRNGKWDCKNVIRAGFSHLQTAENWLPPTSEKIKKIGKDETETAQKTFAREKVGTQMPLMLAPLDTLKLNPAEQRTSDNIAQSQSWYYYSDYPLEDECPNPHKPRPVVERSIGMYDGADHPREYMKRRLGYRY